jgi:histidinol-phosphate aminotransferase
MLVVGNGSNEIIELLVRAFIRPGDEAVMAEPSFAVYPIVMKCAGGVSRRVPLTGDFRHDLPAMAREINDRTRVVFIANPNNPTGTIVGAGEFEAFLDRVPEDVIVCMDEAYFEFVSSGEYPDTLAYVKSLKRPILLLRTFSKVYGLAGLRVGFGVAHPELAGYLERVRQPFNVNTLAQAAALASLDDDEHLRRTVENNARGLEYLYGEIEKMGLDFVRTEANFFMVKVGDGKGVYDKLLRKGVIVRPMASYGMGEYIRVSVGLTEENERFVKTLREALG